MREDAFPSGHALHIGALACPAGTLPAGPRRVVRTLAVGLSLTRVAVLAHWASDVAVGFAVGVALGTFFTLLDGVSARTCSRRGPCHFRSEGGRNPIDIWERGQ